jgi:hypothetical protein
MLASEAGLGGFVSSLAASLAGTYVNSEIMPQRNFSDDPNWKPSALGSTGSVEFGHDGHGFHATNVDFNQQAFKETIDSLKAKIFEQCLDQNVSVEEAVFLARKTESDLTEVTNGIAAASSAVQEIDRQAKEEVQHKIVEVPDEAPVVVKRQAERENLNTLSTTVRKSAQEKIHIIDQQIQAAEAKKTEISARLQHIPDAKESATTLVDSLIDGLKAAKDGLIYVVQNPMEAAHRAYGATKLVGQKIADKTAEIADFVWNQPQEALNLTVAKFSQMYQAAKSDAPGAALDLAEYAPFGIEATVEGSRDLYGVYVSGTQKLRPTVDKWRNFGLVMAVGGKGGKKIAGEVLEAVSDVGKKTHIIGNKIGRTGKQSRLRELMNDDKLGSAEKGWLKQDANAIIRDRAKPIGKSKRTTLRVPPGKVLAHKRGFEAAKGYDYRYADIQEKGLHDTQHKFDKWGDKTKTQGKNKNV